MKKLILVLFLFSFFLIACDNSVDNSACDINNYRDYVFNSEKMRQLRAKGLSCDLRNADLRGADLRGADLRGANLRGADLSAADLREVNLQAVDLRWVDLRGANLVGADLRGADLRKAKLLLANLAGADLRDTNLSTADIEKETYLQGAKYNDATNFPGIFGDFYFEPEGRGMIKVEMPKDDTSKEEPKPSTPSRKVLEIFNTKDDTAK